MADLVAGRRADRRTTRGIGRDRGAGPGDLERQLRASVIASCYRGRGNARQRTTTQTTEPDAERRERIELRGRASLTSYLLARIEGRQVTGAEAELSSGCRSWRRDSA